MLTWALTLVSMGDGQGALSTDVVPVMSAFRSLPTEDILISLSMWYLPILGLFPLTSKYIAILDISLTSHFILASIFRFVASILMSTSLCFMSSCFLAMMPAHLCQVGRPCAPWRWSRPCSTARRKTMMEIEQSASVRWCKKKHLLSVEICGGSAKL